MSETENPGLFALAADAGQDAIRYARAEVAYWKALAAERAAVAGIGLGLVFAASVLAGATIVALLVGLVFILYAPLGGWSVLLVVVLALALAGLLGWLGVKRLKEAARKPDLP